MSTAMPDIRKWMLIPALMALLLSACGPSTGLTADSATTTRRASELALGTLSLEGSAMAVDAAAAAELLPMWELLSDLSISSTAAPEELAATITAIEAAMTPDQLAAIEAMDLSGIEAGSASLAGAPAAAAAVGSGANPQMPDALMDPAMGGEAGAAMGADIPMEGGMPPGGADQPQTGRGSTSTASSGGMYRDVIALLQSKTPS